MVLGKRVILITGVSGGIGTAILKDFMGEAKQIMTSSRREWDQFYNGKELPSNVTHVPMDLTVESNVIELFDLIKKETGKLDVLVNCVGGSLFKHSIEDFPVEEFQKVLSVNLVSAFLLTKHAIKMMKENGGGGNIVHFVSSSAKKISRGKAPYGIAKAGLARLIHYAASEVAGQDICVNGISPTYVFTNRHEDDIKKKMASTNASREEVVEGILSHQLLKKEMRPEDLLGVTRLLVTTRCITGQVYNCAMGEVLNY